MTSLLTMELNNYNISNKLNKNINTKKNEITENIENYFKKNKNMTNEYSINVNIFNPTKNSPPNEWQFRLIKRINSLKDCYDPDTAEE